MDRIKKLYEKGTTRVSVNNILGKSIKNIMESLRQGDLPSMIWFIIAMDPLLVSLKRLLKGIVTRSVVAEGPLNEGEVALLRHEEMFQVLGYADDLKPGISSLEEIDIIIEQCRKLERASGVKLHRDPKSGKCKLLPLGCWNSNLRQEMIPFDFIKITDGLDIMGVKLCSKFHMTRVKNSEYITEKVDKITNMWKSGRYMALVDRAHTLNSNVLSKVWFRTSSIPLRVQDVQGITRSMKAWMLKDQFNRNISDQIVYRPIEQGRLGLYHIQSRAESHLL